MFDKGQQLTYGQLSSVVRLGSKTPRFHVASIGSCPLQVKFQLGVHLGDRKSVV